MGNIYPKASLGSRKLILLYHSVGNTPWGMSEKNFADQINLLHDHCDILTLSELIQSKPSDKIQVAITFDDGYACLYNVAAPIMQPLNIPAMVYLNTDSTTRKSSQEKLGHYPDEQFLLWDEVKLLQQLGWEFGSHGVNHLHFTTIDAAIAVEELTSSKHDIENHLGQECHHFAYTWGEYTAALKKIVQEVGYHYATAVIHAPINSKSNPFSLPRMNIANEYSLQDFQNIILGKWDYLGLLQKARRLL